MTQRGWIPPVLCTMSDSGNLVHRFRGLADTCVCGLMTLPPVETDPLVTIARVVAEMRGPAYVGRDRLQLLADWLDEARRQLAGP